MRFTDLQFDMARLKDVCSQHRVSRLEVFGSFVRGDASDESDVDLLVTFEPGVRAGLDLVTLKLDLESLLGRSVDLLPRSSVERSPNKYFRRFVLQDMEPLYECA